MNTYIGCRYADASQAIILAEHNGSAMSIPAVRGNADYERLMIAGVEIASFEPPPVDLLEYLKNRRWLAETGGVTVGGIRIVTDDRSKLLLMGARALAIEDPAHTEPWQLSDGSSVTLDSAAIIAASSAVAAHVSACFDLYATLFPEIAAGTLTMEQIDAAAWPGSE